MGLFRDLIAAHSHEVLTFGEAYRRIRCKNAGHVKGESSLINKLLSKNHPENNDDYMFVVNVVKCHNCFAAHLVSGMEMKFRLRRDGYLGG